MASTFSLTSSSYDGRYMTLSCSQSKDVETNTSTITWTLTSTGGNDKYYSTGPTTVKINETEVYYCARKDWATKEFPAAKGSKSGTITVNHDQYGDASINVSLKTAIYVGASSATEKSGTWELDNIPRASQPSCITWPSTTDDVGNIGDTITIHMNRVSSSFTHTVSYGWHNKTGTIASNVTNNCTWKIPTDFAENIPTATSGWGTIYVDTYNGSTKIGTKSVKFTVHVPSYNLSQVPATISLNNENAVINNWGVAIKGFTKLNWSVTPQPSQYYNYITNYYLCLIPNKDNFDVDNSICDLTNTTSTSGITDYLTYTPGTYRVKMTAKDSRGKWSNYVLRDPSDSTKPLKLTIYDYSAPKIQNASAFRCNSSGTAMDSGTYLSISCSGIVGASIDGRNGISAVYQWRVVGDEYNAKASIPDAPIGEFPVTNAFEVKLTVRDTIGSETTKVISIPLGKTDFHLTPYGAGFGIYHDSNKPNTIQTAWDLEIKGNTIEDFVVEKGTSGGWAYEKMSSGVLKQWGIISPTFTSWSKWITDNWWYGSASPIIFGKSFIENSQPMVLATSCALSWAIPTIENISNSQFNLCGVRPNAGSTSSGAYYYSIYAIGRWK